EGGLGESPAAGGPDSSLGSGRAVRGPPLPRAVGGGRPPRLAVADRQSVRQRAGQELHQDAEARRGLPARRRDRAGRDRTTSQLLRRDLQPETPALRPGLSAPGGVRGPTCPACGGGQSVRPRLSTFRGSLQFLCHSKPPLTRSFRGPVASTATAAPVDIVGRAAAA